MNQIAARLEEAYPETNSNVGANVVPLRDALNFASDIIAPMSIIMVAAVGFVLLIACANVANLMLSRAISRRREISLRAALGAKRWRIVRQLLTESAVVAFLGGALGVLIAQLGARGIDSYIPADLYKVGAIDIDSTALIFTLGLCLLTTVVFGLTPALDLSRVNLSAALREGSAGAGSARRSRRLHDILVVAEISMAIILLLGTTLMIRTFNNLQKVDTGFRSAGVMAMTLSLRSESYDRPMIQQLHRQLLSDVSQISGVESAAIVNYLPLNHETDVAEFNIDGLPKPKDQPWQAVRLTISPDYFRTLGIQVEEGRAFNPFDSEEAPRVVIINRAMAERFWPQKDPLGNLIKLDQEETPYTIVGVVNDTKQHDLAGRFFAQIFVPQAQHPSSYFRVLYRSQSDPAAQLAAVRNAIRKLDPDLPLSQVRRLDEVVEEYLLPQQAMAQILASLAAGALILAAVGIYGLMAYFVNQRTREIGIRVALGAGRVKIINMVFGKILVLTTIGLVIGLGGALGLTQLMTSLLHGVSGSDPLTLAITAVCLVAVAILAGLAPTRRALRVDPINVLRYE